MTALNLSPEDTNYLTSSLMFQHISENTGIVTLASSDVSTSGQPFLILTGNGEAQLSGSITIDSNPIANMPIFSLNRVLEKGVIFPVTVLSAGVYISNAIRVNSDGEGILLNAPLALDVVVLDTPKFLLKSYN